MFHNAGLFRSWAEGGRRRPGLQWEALAIDILVPSWAAAASLPSTQVMMKHMIPVHVHTHTHIHAGAPVWYRTLPPPQTIATTVKCTETILEEFCSIAPVPTLWF